MHSKRSLIRMFTRILYAGGFIFLVAGLLLSAVSSPALAAGSLSAFGAPTKAGTLVPDCGCTPSPVGGHTATPVPGGASSLVFSSGCNCSCQAASATVCNVGSGNMKTSVKWLLYYSVDGNPAVNGSQVTGGTLGPLNAGQCVNLNYQPKAAGNYAYYVEQEKGAAGPSYAWSNSCLVNGSCFPATHTPTPFSPATHTPTSVPPTHTYTPAPIELTITPTASKTALPSATATTAPPPTSTATRPPLPYNLSAVCGYAGEQTRLWKVANHTNVAVNYTWRADNGETGKGSVGANADDYFTTTLAANQVELSVGGERVDTEQSVAPCKQLAEISYSCTATGLEWTVHNPNNFGIDFSWKLDTGETGHGTLAAGSSSMVAASTKGAHRLDVTWTDTRPGTHTVSLSSPMNSCESTVTNTPTPPPTATYTYTPPPVVVTLTNTPPPTSTYTPPPTETFTPHPPTLTVTPSNTAPGYPPPVIVTLTSTYTNTPVPTATNTPVPPNTATTAPPPPVVVTVLVTNTSAPTSTASNTPVPTNTPVPPNTATSAPPVIITVLVSNTPVPATTTPVPTNTNTSVPPASFVTVTSAPTNTNTAVPTMTNTSVPAIVTIPGYPAPATSVPTNTATTGPTNTPTSLVTLPPPVAQATQTPVLIPVTGVDLTRPVGANGLSILGSLLTNLGLFTLGLALALTGYSRFTRR